MFKLNLEMLRRLGAASAALFFLVACGDRPGPDGLLAPDEASLSTTYGATLLECPIDTSSTVTATVGVLGKKIEVDGHYIDIPALAVSTPTDFTFTVPAGNYLEVQIQAGGQEHFEFNQAVTLTLSYERCTRSNIDKADLHIYYIDPVTKEVLEDLGGVDDKTARLVTTTTDHLSQYAVGTP